ncbi:uncharacterized protein F5Z01DRAFT_68768 [Emericellopsis atlantica]|uniref:Uncharacterized protein n=1 Tax=Emericellopsis atlantica TaxID=2614577 RepID=A0A9P7ZMU8_9HYPO|nr:uncharacterized protein F5Z01DRAFT_68768 [Emericellopsis atlantica]KAG9255034.1 hypothetical protein F5Z01DRAFT_68768 [Emericellopsis atlantica]
MLFIYIYVRDLGWLLICISVLICPLLLIHYGRHPSSSSDLPYRQARKAMVASPCPPYHALTSTITYTGRGGVLQLQRDSATKTPQDLGRCFVLHQDRATNRQSSTFPSSSIVNTGHASRLHVSSALPTRPRRLSNWIGRVNMNDRGFKCASLGQSYGGWVASKPCLSLLQRLRTYTTIGLKHPHPPRMRMRLAPLPLGRLATPIVSEG